jgi:hypothetical protein
MRLSRWGIALVLVGMAGVARDVSPQEAQEDVQKCIPAAAAEDAELGYRCAGGGSGSRGTWNAGHCGGHSLNC